MARLVLPRADRGDRKIAEDFARRGSRGVIGIGIAKQDVEIAGTEAAAFGGAHAETFIMGARGGFVGGGLAVWGALSVGGVPPPRAGPRPMRRIISPARPRYAIAPRDSRS